MDLRVIEVTNFKTEVRIWLWDNLESNGKLSLQVMRGSPLVLFRPMTIFVKKGISAIFIIGQNAKYRLLWQFFSVESCFGRYQKAKFWHLPNIVWSLVSASLRGTLFCLACNFPLSQKSSARDVTCQSNSYRKFADFCLITNRSCVTWFTAKNANKLITQQSACPVSLSSY